MSAGRPGDRIAFGLRIGTIFTVRGSTAVPLYVVDFDDHHRALIADGPAVRIQAVPFAELPTGPQRRGPGREQTP